MFCANCGCQQPDSSAFCTNCGVRLDAGAPNGGVRQIRRPITKAEYFSRHCSGEAKQKIKNIKTMGWIGLVLQSVLAVLSILIWIAFEELASSDPWMGDGAEIILVIPAMIAVFAAFSFAFTILGVNRRSTGFLITATVFAFFTTSLSGSVFASEIRLPLSFGMLILYVVMAVFSCQINGEYKAYLQRNFMR